MSTRKYFVKRGDFANNYSLVYTENGERPSGDGWAQITRKDAETLASSEARRRKENPSFGGYADMYIYPHDMTEQERYDLECRRGWHTEGRIAVKD